MNMNDIIQTIAIYAIPVIFAITLHEAAHGYSAKLLGDDTAYQLGRVTLNPIKHIDPVGTLLIPTALYLATAGSFLFGYAKPVPVRFGNLNHPKRDMIWVALAGPGSNFFQAVLWGIAYILLLGNSVQERFFIEMCQAGILVNVVMFAFNLFPLPPLDGGRIMTGLLPWKWAVPFSRIEPYGFFVVLALVISGLISQYWMFPLMGASYWLIDIILVPLRMIFY
ncbi:site-2 protease family protein [Polynucleobacter sp. MWH-Loch1C5]|uniref:site-2 protease family protein n=1 Tax=Polynucleobacter sp. MWH-Loch1C5 TaxID=2689108 RepID=UPI001C0CE1C0|nr:site-2 protease family protein [Polynucleobacter sp. MWH-Loch1C5]MBU3542833.1 site-2 protease family protein [Polynucleobacter sp. MWH-Loch1C5]